MASKPRMSLNLSLDGIKNDDGLKNSVVQSLNNINQKKENSNLEPRTLKRITYTKISSSELNDYPIENIAEMETLLLMYGLLEPLSVNYDEDIDKYELESGDRRFHAIKNLFTKYENATEESVEKSLYTKNVHGLYVNGIPCMVESGSRDRETVRERIIIHNETNRPFDAMRTSAKISELAAIYTRQNNLLPSNERFNVNEKIADALLNRYTVRQIIRYKNFDKLIDELKQVILRFDMSVSEISTYHSLTEEEQSVLAKYITMYHIDGKKLVLPTMDEIRKSVEITRASNNSYFDSRKEEMQPSVLTESEQNNNLEEEGIDTADTLSAKPDKLDLDILKEQAAKRIKEGQVKKDKKITDVMSVIQKKSIQLEKVISDYIEDTDLVDALDAEALVNDIDSTIQILIAIKESIR